MFSKPFSSMFSVLRTVLFNVPYSQNCLAQYSMFSELFCSMFAVLRTVYFSIPCSQNCLSQCSLFSELFSSMFYVLRTVYLNVLFSQNCLSQCSMFFEMFSLMFGPTESATEVSREHTMSKTNALADLPTYLTVIVQLISINKSCQFQN